MYADIIVDITHEQLDKSFQYKVPERLESELEEGMLVNIPFGTGNRMITGYVIELGQEPKYDIAKLKEIDSIVPDKVRMIARLIRLAAWLKNHYGATMNQALRTVIPVKDKIKSREKKTVCLAVDLETAEEYAEDFEKKKNAVARARLMRALLAEPEIDFDIIKRKLNISQSTVKTLENAGLVEVKTENLYRNPVRKDFAGAFVTEPNRQQQKVIDTFVRDYDNGVRKTYLLHGITGSGKTVCYIEMIAHVVAQGKQVIMLIPEIALTFQTVQRFYRRFGDAVSIMNSRMSKGERYDQFLRAMRGEISIMIGPRSALFTPFSDIGLIVIDEEHESAYKSETAPKYHARETAVHIAKEAGASVVLGSATPSMEAYYRAQSGVYELLTLDKRATGAALPKIHTVDLRKELKEGNRSVFSRQLQSLIADRLQKNEQTMLFLNKRGYAGFISCRACGYVVKCPHCDISMTEHKNQKLICHFCGYEQPKITICPKCGSKYISGFRAGTQQIEERLQKQFPQARVLRMDMDTTSGKEGHEKILSEFANHEADILVGTQMIVKGHDFPSVTLVGILAADLSLHAGDYRACEKTFQLLVQAAGRAGRGIAPGEVVIQTYTPDNYSIAAAAKQDYDSFYREEMAFRRMMGYPPAGNLLQISFSSQDEQQLLDACGCLKEKNDALSDARLTIMGPVPAPIYKISDIYTQILYIKANSYEALTDYKDFIEIYVSRHCKSDGIYVQYDFN